MTQPDSAQPIALKIAYIGGSREWVRKLMFDLALCPDLTGEVALYDIGLASAQLNAVLGAWLQTQPGGVSSWHYAAVESLDDALQGAHLVVISIQPGSLECMVEEVAITERHGIFLPVGGTTGAPGLVRGLRAATMYAGFARAIAAICPGVGHQLHEPDDHLHAHARRARAQGVRLLPRSVCLPGVARRVGGPLSAPRRAAQAERDPRQRHRHQPLHLDRPRALWRRRPAGPPAPPHRRAGRFYGPTRRPRWRVGTTCWRSAEQVKFSLFQRFGLLVAAGDRHLVEFLPGFTRSPEKLFKWGVIRTPIPYRIARHYAAPAKTRDKDLAFQAILGDPTPPLPIDEAWTMFNELLHAGREYLPGWDIN